MEAVQVKSDKGGAWVNTLYQRQFPGFHNMPCLCKIWSLEEAGRKVHGNSLYYRLQLLVNLKLSKI